MIDQRQLHAGIRHCSTAAHKDRFVFTGNGTELSVAGASQFS
jgi:hypothetical protein